VLTDGTRRIRWLKTPDHPGLQKGANELFKEGHCILVGDSIAVDCQANKMRHLDTKVENITEAEAVDTMIRGQN
jgi:hypothetical protein